MTGLQLDDVSAGHRGGTHLHHITLSLTPGRVLAVVGHNGAGKTTLLHTIAALLRPTNGRILFNGTDITGLPPHRRARAGISYLPQGARIWPSLTVEEHLNLALHRRSPSPAQWTVARVWEVLPQLAAKRRQHGRHLSGGQQQMLALARALLTGPRLLLLDEPTEGLAPAITAVIRTTIGALADDGVTILIATPRPQLAAATATGTVHVLSTGRLRTALSAVEARADPARIAAALAFSGSIGDTSETSDPDGTSASSSLIPHQPPTAPGDTR